MGRRDYREIIRQMEERLKHKAINGAFWSGIQKFGLSAISFLSNIVLARMLTPDDYGCIGMLTIFLVLSNSLILGGFVSALIQKHDVTQQDYSTVFYWNVGISVLLYLVLYLASPSIASFYHIDKLSSLLRVLGITLIINGFCAVQTTRLRKFLEFGVLARINIASAIISTILAIILAYFGFGIWSLVFQQISLSVFNAIFLWKSTTWKPSLLFSIQSFNSLFSYGSFLLLNELVNVFCDNLQGLLIGKYFSASTMGYYTQARKLEIVPTQSITQMVSQVTFPIFSKIQNDKERLYRAVRESVALMNFLNFPLMLLLIVIAKPLIACLYSEKWLPAVPYFQILCFAGIPNCLQNVNYHVVSAAGRSKILFKWNFVKRGIGLLFMFVGLCFGVEGLLWGMAAGIYFTFVVNAKLAFQSSGYSLYKQLTDSLPLLCISVIAALCSYSITLLDCGHGLMLTLQLSVFITIYIFLSFVTERKELREAYQIITNYISRQRHDR